LLRGAKSINRTTLAAVFPHSAGPIIPWENLQPFSQRWASKFPTQGHRSTPSPSNMVLHNQPWTTLRNWIAKSEAKAGAENAMSGSRVKELEREGSRPLIQIHIPT